MPIFSIQLRMKFEPINPAPPVTRIVSRICLLQANSIGYWLYSQIMVRFTVLASGSKGNCTVVTGGRTRILVDAGLSCREIFRRMRLAGEEPETLNAIVVTHEHQDHVGGLAVTARNLGIPVYFTEGTHRAWMRWLNPRRQMTYAQWLEQGPKEAAERQAEAETIQSDAEGDPDEADLMVDSGPVL